MTHTKETKKRIPKAGLCLYLGLLSFVLLFTWIVWHSKAFCDFYIAHIFPIWVNTYGRLTGLFPFSVGEWLILAGVVLVAAAALFVPVTALCVIAGRIRSRKGKSVDKVSRGISFLRGFYRFFAWVLLIVCVIMTLNCVVLYHASPFSETYFTESREVYTTDNLVTLRNFVVSRCNALAPMMQRDERGRIVYNPQDLSEMSTERALQKKAVQVMQQMGEQYPNLSGFYPSPKAMLFSDFMCQQYMAGYFFPFSMEANYNKVMCLINKPSAICHELSHLKGYILEDEANFISFLACVGSDDPAFQYSGYLSVLNYLEREVRYLQKDAAFAKRYELVEVLPQVTADNLFVYYEDWERIEKNAILDTQVVDAVSDSFVDTSLKVNGVADGMHSYSRVVQLLLCYYFTK